MNIPIASWRVLHGEVGRRVERERRERLKARAQALGWTAVIMAAAFALWVS